MKLTWTKIPRPIKHNSFFIIEADVCTDNEMDVYSLNRTLNVFCSIVGYRCKSDGKDIMKYYLISELLDLTIIFFTVDFDKINFDEVKTEAIKVLLNSYRARIKKDNEILNLLNNI